MTVIQDLQAVLIEALLREVTPEQAGRALDRLVRVVDGPAFVVSPEEDEAAAAWLCVAMGQLRGVAQA